MCVPLQEHYPHIWSVESGCVAVSVFAATYTLGGGVGNCGIKFVKPNHKSPEDRLKSLSHSIAYNRLLVTFIDKQNSFWTAVGRCFISKTPVSLLLTTADVTVKKLRNQILNYSSLMTNHKLFNCCECYYVSLLLRSCIRPTTSVAHCNCTRFDGHLRGCRVPLLHFTACHTSVIV